MKKRISIILSAVTVLFCAFTIVFFTRGNAAMDNTHGNKLQHVNDESVYITEPPENKGKVPAHVRWEPMLGYYILKDAKYDPNTKSFIIPDEGLLSTADPNNEQARIDDWMSKNKNTKDEFLASLAAYETKKETVLSGSSRYLPEKDDSITEGIIPLGIPYLNDMMDMVMNKKLFDVPLTYAIGQITGTDCQPQGMSYDDYEQTHDQWRSNMKSLLGGVEQAVINGDDLSKYGVFVLPYLSDMSADRLEIFQAKNVILLQKLNISSDILSNRNEWTSNNSALISEIKGCIDSYK